VTLRQLSISNFQFPKQKMYFCSLILTASVVLIQFSRISCGLRFVERTQSLAFVLRRTQALAFVVRRTQSLASVVRRTPPLNRCRCDVPSRFRYHSSTRPSLYTETSLNESLRCQRYVGYSNWALLARKAFPCPQIFSFQLDTVCCTNRAGHSNLYHVR
jgi:hypothetical protein